MAKHEQGDQQETGKGSTGRFMPCPVGLYSHPDNRTSCEIKWSTKKRRNGRLGTAYYYSCAYCGTRTFVNDDDWRPTWGMTILEVEEEGYALPKMSVDRKDELLAEFGLKRARPGSVRKKKRRRRPLP